MADKTRFGRYIEQLEDNKKKLLDKVNKLEELAQQVENLIPAKYDFKSRYILQDRIDSISKLYETILRYRSEIASQIKEQVNIEKLEEQPDDLQTGKEAVLSLTMHQLQELFGVEDNSNDNEMIDSKIEGGTD